MSNKRTKVRFQGTAEQEARLRAAIARHRGAPGTAMPVMQEAQEIYGYLPEEVQILIAEGLGIPLSEVYGIATFYAQFTLNPKGTIRISVCLGTACYVKGSAAILEEVCRLAGCQPDEITPDGRISVDTTRCVGACGLAPVMIVNGDVYRSVRGMEGVSEQQNAAKRGAVLWNRAPFRVTGNMLLHPENRPICRQPPHAPPDPDTSRHSPLHCHTMR